MCSALAARLLFKSLHTDGSLPQYEVIFFFGGGGGGWTEKLEEH